MHLLRARKGLAFACHAQPAWPQVTLSACLLDPLPWVSCHTHSLNHLLLCNFPMQVGCEVAGFEHGLNVTTPAQLHANRCSFTCREDVVHFVDDEMAQAQAGGVDEIKHPDCAIVNSHLPGHPGHLSMSVIRNTVGSAEEALGRPPVAQLLPLAAFHAAATKAVASVTPGSGSAAEAGGDKSAGASRSYNCSAGSCGTSSSARWVARRGPITQ